MAPRRLSSNKRSTLNLLRALDMTDIHPTQPPCRKEWIAEDFDEMSEEFEENALRMGQQMVGELLWLTM